MPWKITYVDDQLLTFLGPHLQWNLYLVFHDGRKHLCVMVAVLPLLTHLFTYLLSIIALILSGTMVYYNRSIPPQFSHWLNTILLSNQKSVLSNRSIELALIKINE